MKEAPNYYAIIPAPVRYAEDLSEFQKLLYAEITALSQKDWYCYASNNYFSGLYNKSKDWISKCILKMWELWYLKIEYDKEAWNVRKIFIWELVKLKWNIKAPIKEKHDRGYRRKILHPIEEKSDTPIEEKCNHNNINNNNTSGIGIEQPTTPQHKNIEYINGMRSVELKGKQYLWAWNELIGDNAIMSSEVKKGIYNIQNSISAEDFKARVEKFATIKDLIVRKNKQKYFYYPIWEWTLDKFLEHINKFYWEDSLIISRIANKENKNQALSILKVQDTTQYPVQVEKKEMTEQEKAEALKTMQQAKEKLLNHTTV